MILGAHGQTLIIRQDSYDRFCYMPGVVLACKHIAEHPGLTEGLDAVPGDLNRQARPRRMLTMLLTITITNEPMMIGIW